MLDSIICTGVRLISIAFMMCLGLSFWKSLLLHAYFSVECLLVPVCGDRKSVV